MVSARNQNPLDTPRLITIVEARQKRLNLPWEALVCLNVDVTSGFPY